MMAQQTRDLPERASMCDCCGQVKPAKLIGLYYLCKRCDTNPMWLPEANPLTGEQR